MCAFASRQLTAAPDETIDVSHGHEPAQHPRLSRLMAVAVFVVALACIVVTLPGAWLLVGTLGLGVSITGRNVATRTELLTSLLCITVGFTAVDYLTWRVEATNWAGWVIATPLLAAEIFGAIHTLGLQYTVWPWPQPQITPAEDPARWPIFLFIPTVDEGPSVLGPTIQAALEARRRYLRAYPQGQVSIVVCNDGRVAGAAGWPEVEALAQRLGVVCLTRTVDGGHKAGNLEHARQQVGATGEALLAIFDADQVAKPEFLLKTVPPFADPTVGWVQTGQYYRNLEQPVARWANDQQALFYRVLCPGKAAHNAAFICGTNVVIRAAALDQIGGLPQDSVTEDFAASIQLHPRWRSLYLTDVLATGLGPMDLPAFLKQQRRWATGTIGVLRRHWRAIFLPRRHGLRLDQRLQYFLACTHYLCGLRDLIYIVSPLLFLATGIPAVRGASLGLFLWHFVPYWLAAQGAFWYAGHRRETGLRGIIVGFGSFPVLLVALLTVLLGRRIGFMVTSKHQRARRRWAHLSIYLIALGCCLAGIGLAFVGRRARPESVAISVLWVLYDIVLLGSFLWLGISDLRFKEAPVGQRRLAIGHVSTSVRSAWHPTLRWMTAALTGCVVMGDLLVVGIQPPATRPVQFTVSLQKGQSPVLGLSLPIELLKARPAALEQQLCLPFTIIGRTQVIQDSFDSAWANQLAAHGQRPWITLQFGQFGPNGKVPLDASLLAIANGLQDTNIRRWAQDIHTYGKPVYLTILLHVDRNWAVTSAVANGGIPQDVPRAWEHVQSIFKAMGDTNVAWVWAPADPADDKPYAPPETTIDAVLQSMIRYPGTPWPDPAAVLSAVTARHPTKPVFVELTASGAPAQKAAWLQQMVAEVRGHQHVYALLYHEGGPDVQAIAAVVAQWSIESDPLSLHAMLSWQALVPASELPCRISRPASATPQTGFGSNPPDAPVNATSRDMPLLAPLTGGIRHARDP